MELREPRKKKRVRLQPQQSLPLIYNDNGELTVFTSHLRAFGTCIVNPDEMEAVNSMGFFGKGSLSRNYPSFGQSYYGAPPVIRQRQWLQRKKWYDEVKKLSAESIYEDQNYNDSKTSNTDGDVEMLDEDKNEGSITNDNSTKSRVSESELEVLEMHKKPEGQSSNEIATSKNNAQTSDNKLCKNETRKEDDKSINVDEVVLDSTEDEDVCEITSKENENDALKENASLLIDQELDLMYSRDENQIDLQGKVLVLPDSDSDTENYLRDIKPRLENEGFPVTETLHLTFEETFFLSYALGCLQVVDFDGKLLTIRETWDHFSKESKNFIPRYIVYHYFRSKGWVVKPGLKYGGDFLLYKDGPPFYHASYIVIVDVDEKTDDQSLHKTTWKKVFGMERLSESAAKEILFAQVLWPSSIPKDCSSISPEDLSQFTVRELLLRRWIPKKKKPFLYSEDEDDESS